VFVSKPQIIALIF